ncbi:DUF3870 domain-containing protein [Aquibium sp. LZ166]|uniref:DUF3870 domain-containing protein n=1 Tax=Aquibium pacificus TaxID=3153579 RepID=A0ABV3SPB8_9HYPH
MANKEPTILLTGYAPAPKGTVMQEKQRLFGVVLEVEMRNGRIVGADVPGVTDLSKDFFRRVAVGYELSNGVEKLCEKVRARYWTSSTDSLIACLKMIGQRYEEGLKRLACGDPRTASLRGPQTTTRVRELRSAFQPQVARQA